jgi:MFS family permease
VTITKEFLSRYVVALRYRDFVHIWLGSLGGQSAYWSLIVARGVLVLDMTGSSALVGITTFAAMAPRFIMPPLSGYFADRFDRRTVLATAYALQFVITALLTALAFSDVLEVWHLIVLSTLSGSFRTFQMTATQALVPNLVPREHLLNALALNQLTQQGSRLVGPGLAAPALLLVGPEAAFLASTLYYVVAFGSVSTIHTRSSGGLERGAKLGASLWEAMRFAWTHPQMRSLFILVALHCSMTMAFESMLPIYSRDVLDQGMVGVSYLMMGVGAGAVVGVLIIAGLRGEVVRGRLLLVTGVLSGASMIALAAATSTPIALIAAAFMGASEASFMAVGGAMVQSLAPDHMRGRISGLNQINVGGTMAVVNLVNGFAADAVGAPTVLTVLGTGFVLVMAASLLLATVRGVYGGAIATRLRTT